MEVDNLLFVEENGLLPSGIVHFHVAARELKRLSFAGCFWIGLRTNNRSSLEAGTEIVVCAPKCAFSHTPHGAMILHSTGARTAVAAKSLSGRFGEVMVGSGGSLIDWSSLGCTTSQKKIDVGPVSEACGAPMSSSDLSMGVPPA